VVVDPLYGSPISAIVLGERTTMLIDVDAVESLWSYAVANSVLPSGAEFKRFMVFFSTRMLVSNAPSV
jgi:hypothetical protein